MTDPVLVAALAAASSTVAAVIGLLNNRAQAMARAASETTAAATQQQLTEIHVLVNSGMTKALADFAEAQEEIRSLRSLVLALNKRLDAKDTV